MRNSIILILVSFLLTVGAYAQNVKAPPKDTTSAYRANDRLKTAGPTNGWPGKTTEADSIKAKKDSIAPIRRTKAENKTKRKTN